MATIDLDKLVSGEIRKRILGLKHDEYVSLPDLGVDISCDDHVHRAAGKRMVFFTANPQWKHFESTAQKRQKEMAMEIANKFNLIFIEVLTFLQERQPLRPDVSVNFMTDTETRAIVKFMNDVYPNVVEWWSNTSPGISFIVETK